MPLNRQCQTIVDALAAASSAPPDKPDHLAARAAYAKTTAFYQHATDELASVEDRSFPGPGGEVPIRVYRPYSEGGSAPCLLFFHGGGWSLGDLDSHDHMCRHFAHGAQATVIAVDYRLAPEHKFPAAVDDSVAAVRWVFENARQLGPELLSEDHADTHIKADNLKPKTHHVVNQLRRTLTHAARSATTSATTAHCNAVEAPIVG